MSNFADTMRKMGDMTITENGGRSFKTTGSAMLDMFANIGGMRKRSKEDITCTYHWARIENPELADNCILYARDIRHAGLGERRIGRILLHELALVNQQKVENNLHRIVDCGRWDDLFVLIDTPVEPAMWKYVKKQIMTDVTAMKDNKSISLLAKWLPSINTSSTETRKLARKVCKNLNLTERTYRKTLSALRKYINVVERSMSDGNWDAIDFESVPSVAMSRYINAFDRHLPESFLEYKYALQNGEAKVNASTLYPYDIIRPYIWRPSVKKIDAVSEAQWTSLPNYVDESTGDVVCVCDTSGSMTCDECRPLATAVGLGVYFAQRNKGAYHNMFMTFSETPTIQKIEDNWSLQNCIDYVLHSKWGFSTNLDAAFKLIYDIAKESHDAPRALMIISDMEIDCWSSNDAMESIAQKWDKKFKEIGLECPKIIYWNVESRHSNTLSQCSENVGYVSGSSAGAFKFMQTLIEKSAYDAMVEILTLPEYSWT